MAEATAERVRLGGDILIALAHAVAANEKTQRRFRTAVLIRLSKIETMLTEVQGAQLVQLWPPDRVYEHQRNEVGAGGAGPRRKGEQRNGAQDGEVYLWGRRGVGGGRCAPRQKAELVWLGDLIVTGRTAAAFVWSECAAGARG